MKITGDVGVFFFYNSKINAIKCIILYIILHGNMQIFQKQILYKMSIFVYLFTIFYIIGLANFLKRNHKLYVYHCSFIYYIYFIGLANFLKKIIYNKSIFVYLFTIFHFIELRNFQK